MLFNQEAEWDDYPGTIGALERKCQQLDSSARVTVPSEETWADGNRNVICFDINFGKPIDVQAVRDILAQPTVAPVVSAQPKVEPSLAPASPVQPFRSIDPSPIVVPTVGQPAKAHTEAVCQAIEERLVPESTAPIRQELIDSLGADPELGGGGFITHAPDPGQPPTIYVSSPSGESLQAYVVNADRSILGPEFVYGGPIEGEAMGEAPDRSGAVDVMAGMQGISVELGDQLFFSFRF